MGIPCLLEQEPPALEILTLKREIEIEREIERSRERSRSRERERERGASSNGNHSTSMVFTDGDILWRSN